MTSERPHPQDEMKGIESAQTFPWLSAEEWFNRLNDRERSDIRFMDRANARFLIASLESIFPKEFKAGDVALFAVNDTAIPYELNPIDYESIDLRMVFSAERTPKNGADFAQIQNRFEETYKTRSFNNVRVFLGDPQRETDSDKTINSLYEKFTPANGSPIRLYLPTEWVYGMSASIDDFVEFHRQMHLDLEARLEEEASSNSKDPLEAEKRRLNILENAYIVRLTS